jgi:hypothetical protein
MNQVLEPLSDSVSKRSFWSLTLYCLGTGALGGVWMSQYLPQLRAVPYLGGLWLLPPLIALVSAPFYVWQQRRDIRQQLVHRALDGPVQAELAKREVELYRLLLVLGTFGLPILTLMGRLLRELANLGYGS